MFKKRLPVIIAGIIFLILQNVAIGASLIPLPVDVELAYDDGTPEVITNWTSGSIAAVRMTPPAGTWKIKTARYLLMGGGKVRIFEDDSGYPGRDLIEGILIESSQMGWNDIDLESYSIMVNGDFYLGLESIDSLGTPFLGLDTAGNERAWMYDSIFENWSYQKDATYFIRAVVTDEPGVEEELTPQTMIALQCNPNPFSGSTAISYALPQAGRVTVSIWDASGRRVRTLVDANEAGGHHSVQWDGADNAGNHLPTGVYFLKLDAHQSTLTQKVVLFR